MSVKINEIFVLVENQLIPQLNAILDVENISIKEKEEEFKNAIKEFVEENNIDLAILLEKLNYVTRFTASAVSRRAINQLKTDFKNNSNKKDEVEK